MNLMNLLLAAMSVDGKAFAEPGIRTGYFTTAASAADVTETLGFKASLVIVFIDVNGTNPNILIGGDNNSDQVMALLITGSSGVITSPTEATSLTIGANSFTVDSTQQTNDGENYWIAFR